MNKVVENGCGIGIGIGIGVLLDQVYIFPPTIILYIFNNFIVSFDYIFF